MIEYINSADIKQILLPFKWDRVPNGYIETHNPCGDIIEAIQDVIVQICLTHMIITESGVAYVYVSKDNMNTSQENLSCFFKYVNKIGERDDYALFQVTGIRSGMINIYENAISKKLVHTLFVDSWINYKQLSSDFVEHDVYARYKPNNGQAPNKNDKDFLIDYINSFSSSVLLSIPACFHQDNIDKYDFFADCYSLGFELFFCGNIDKNNCFISHSFALLWNHGDGSTG